MKKLKKQFLAAVLTAVMAVCAFAGTTPVAAATLSAKQYINKMAKATEKLKSYEMKMNMDMDMSVQGKTTSTKTTSTTIAFASPLKTKTVMTMTIPSNGKDTKIKVISPTQNKKATNCCSTPLRITKPMKNQHWICLTTPICSVLYRPQICIRI